MEWLYMFDKLALVLHTPVLLLIMNFIKFVKEAGDPQGDSWVDLQINLFLDHSQVFFNGKIISNFPLLFAKFICLSTYWHWTLAIIIHQTHYEKSDWSRAFNQFTIACELDMINAISAADMTFIMSSSTSAWLLSPLECSPPKQNGWNASLLFLRTNYVKNV